VKHEPEIPATLVWWWQFGSTFHRTDTKHISVQFPIVLSVVVLRLGAIDFFGQFLRYLIGNRTGIEAMLFGDYPASTSAASFASAICQPFSLSVIDTPGGNPS
jgi:hypothetical protein